MQINDVLQLIRAGFTADEIRGMSAPETTPETQPEQQDAPEAPAQGQDPEPEAPAAPEAPEQLELLTAADVKRIVAEQLKAATQAANARTAQRGPADQPKTAEDVLRELAKSL